jgi:16S rRNA (cytosine967-C5)-methyltransferase
MAERMDGTGRVYAWDLHAHRVDLIRAAARRLNLDNVRVGVRDATVLRDDMMDGMDAVLLDAPCTGLGVMDDKPDVKYRHTQESVKELVETQKKLLETCCRYVKKGGTLVYSTCSVLKDENERQVAAFLKAHPEFVMEKLPESIPEKLRSQVGENGLQLLPCRDGVEGFFIARMKRIG